MTARSEARSGWGVLRVPDLRRIWLAQVMSEVGDWAARIALAVLVFDRTGSTALTGVVAAASLIPWLGPGQALATLGDRFPRRTMMVVADLVRAALFGLMVLPIPVWALLITAVLAGLATPLFESAKSALIPEVVPRKQYGDAIRLTQLTFQAALLAGYLAGGGLVALVGARWAVGINAGSFALSALLIIRLRGGRGGESHSKDEPRLATAARVLLSDAILRRAVLLATVPGACAIVGEALVAVYARQHLNAGDWVIGVLAAAVPTGTILAGLIVPRSGDHRRLLRAAALLGLIGSVVGSALFLWGPRLPFAFLPFLAIGTVFAIMVPANTVGGARLQGNVRASAFGLIQGLVTGGQALGVLAGGFLAQALGASGAAGLLLLPGAAYCLFAFLTVPEMRRPAREGQTRGDERREESITARL